MVEADFTGNYLNAENADDKAIITITSKPTVDQKVGNYGPYMETNMEVECDQKKRIYTPSRESGLRMVKVWGKEMDHWVGKQATIKHVLKQVKGETKTYIEAFPISE